MWLFRERLSDFTKNNLQTAQEWTKSHIELMASYVHPKTGSHLRSHLLRAIMDLAHRRLIRPGKKNSGRIFCIRQVYFTKSCQQIWVRVNQPFISFIHHLWGETVLWGTVFILQTSDNRMQYFAKWRYKLLFRTIEASVGFSRKPLRKISKSSIRPAGSDFCSASSGECLNEH